MVLPFGATLAWFFGSWEASLRRPQRRSSLPHRAAPRIPAGGAELGAGDARGAGRRGRLLGVSGARPGQSAWGRPGGAGCGAPALAEHWLRAGPGASPCRRSSCGAAGPSRRAKACRGLRGPRVPSWGRQRGEKTKSLRSSTPGGTRNMDRGSSAPRRPLCHHPPDGWVYEIRPSPREHGPSAALAAGTGPPQAPFSPAVAGGAGGGGGTRRVGAVWGALLSPGYGGRPPRALPAPPHPQRERPGAGPGRGRAATPGGGGGEPGRARGSGTTPGLRRERGPCVPRGGRAPGPPAAPAGDVPPLGGLGEMFPPGLLSLHFPSAKKQRVGLET